MSHWNLAPAFRPNMTNEVIAEAGDVAWSSEEFLECLIVNGQHESTATAKADEDFMWQAMGSPERRRDLLFGGLPAPFLRVASWFDDRYRAYPARLASFYHLRFAVIVGFLTEHDARLRREGWVKAVGDALAIDPAILNALTNIRITRELGDIAVIMTGGFSSLTPSYAEVIDLAGAFRRGDVAPAPELPDWEGEWEDEPDVDIDLLVEALGVIAFWRSLPRAQRRQADRQLRQAMPRELREFLEPLGGTELIHVLAWLHSEGIESPRQALPIALRVHSTSVFLDQHGERLVRDGWANSVEGKLTLRRPLLKALALHRTDLPAPNRAVRLPSYEEITGIAEALDTASTIRNQQLNG